MWWRRLPSVPASLPWRSSSLSLRRPPPLPFLMPNPSPSFSTYADEGVPARGKKRVEDVMPIATGHEREELEAELEGKKRFDMDAPAGPFGTKDCCVKECRQTKNWPSFVSLHELL